MANELPKSRLATTDASGNRVYLYPAAAKGRYARRKRWVHGALILLFLALPWLRPNGKQLLLLDVAHREFFFFGLHLRAHDAPLILFLFLGFTFTIGFVTAIWGRVWCGWACPQTVFTESVFRKIEQWTEGTHLARRSLDQGPWNGNKIFRKSLKWFLFALASLAVTHSFLAYFVGSRELIGMISSPPAENWASFLVILFTTGVILFDFGWFREQFCVIMCPYGRFQSVMLDSQSLVVGYDANRGEPRRGAVPAGEAQGDCVDCFRCVTVCPTGIDIRRGLQMECIACTACVDACDDVMTRLKKPKGLIRYTTLAELRGRVRRYVTPRAVVYALLAIASIGALAISLRTKDYLEVTALRAAGSPYEVSPSDHGTFVVNHFRLELSNQTGSTQTLTLSIDESAKVSGIELITATNPISLADSAAERADFFVRFPLSTLVHGARKISIRWNTGTQNRELEVTLVGPNA
ncbi:MAG: cytochrome c oxidase accessory protein CcoG [Bdellovibrionota bacterium]